MSKVAAESTYRWTNAQLPNEIHEIQSQYQKWSNLDALLTLSIKEFPVDDKERKLNKVMQVPLNALRIAAVMKMLKTLLKTSASKITDKDPD